MNIGFVVHDFDTREGHGRYAVELVSRLAREHRVTLYAASAAADVPDGVRFRLVPAVRRPAHATMLTFPTAFAAVRGPHDVVHVQGWSAHSADVATAHIVLEAWRDAVRSAHVPAGLGERLLGNTVASREARFYRGARTRSRPPSRWIAKRRAPAFSCRRTASSPSTPATRERDSTSP
jgi:hypothetical protein